MPITVRDNKTGKVLGKYNSVEEVKKKHGKTTPITDEDRQRWFGKSTYGDIIVTPTDVYQTTPDHNTIPNKGSEVQSNYTYSPTEGFNLNSTTRSPLALSIGGYDMYTGNPNYYHGNFTNDFLKSLGYAGLVGAGIAAPMLIPEVAGALNLYGAYHGLTNYAKDYHPIETFKKAYKGNYLEALKDIGKVGLDVAEAAPFVGTYISFLNKAKNTGDLIGQILAQRRAAQFAKNLEESAIINSVTPKALTFTELPLRLPYDPNNHLQGDAAVQMFKEYGGLPIPKGSINGEQIMKYVPEARERYGLVGNTNITDEEIAQALYKHSLELGGNTAAVNNQGEPQLLFRSDTKPYTELKSKTPKHTLEELNGSTIDNMLGINFLDNIVKSGELADEGVLKYLHTINESIDPNFGTHIDISASTTVPRRIRALLNKSLDSVPEDATYIGSRDMTYKGKHMNTTNYYKVPSRMLPEEYSTNVINAFIVRTPQVRDMTKEMQTLNEAESIESGEMNWLTPEKPFMTYDKDGYPMINYKGEQIEASLGSQEHARQLWWDQYNQILKDAQNKNQGLLMSLPNKNRREHKVYTYFTLPDFNIRSAKHLLPYDLRVPRDWSNHNIFKSISTQDDEQFNSIYDNLLSKLSGKMTRVPSAEYEEWPYIWKFDLPTNNKWYMDQIRFFNNTVSPRFSNYGIFNPDFTVSHIVKVPNSNSKISGLYNNDRALVRLNNNLSRMKQTAAHESFGHSTEKSLPENVKTKWKNLFKEIDKNGIGTLTNVKSLDWRELRSDIYALLNNLKDKKINVDNLSDTELLDEFDQLGTTYSQEIVNNLYPNIGEPILREASSNIPEKVYITDEKNKLHFIGSTNPTMNMFREAINYWPILTLPLAIGGTGYLINK